jgi:hypothetical protein
VVIDRDVHVLPADRQPAATLGVDASGVPVLAQASAHALAGPALDAAQALDVDVHELAGARALVANGRLQPEPAEPTEPQPAQDAGDGREHHAQRLRDLERRQAQPAQGDDRLHPLARRAVGDAMGCRGAVVQAPLALQAVATDPLAAAAHADAGCLGRRPQRPTFEHDPLGELSPAAPAESRVTVELHPGSSLDWGA